MKYPLPASAVIEVDTSNMTAVVTVRDPDGRHGDLYIPGTPLTRWPSVEEAAKGLRSYIKEAEPTPSRRAPTMEERERELHLYIARAKERMISECQPWLRELGRIDDCKPRRPVILPDGTAVQYVGPMPVWTPDGIKMP